MATTPQQLDFVGRLTEPPTRLELVLLALVHGLTIVGLLTGVLGVAWIVLGPAVAGMSVHFLCKALEKPPAS